MYRVYPGPSWQQPFCDTQYAACCFYVYFEKGELAMLFIVQDICYDIEPMRAFKKLGGLSFKSVHKQTGIRRCTKKMDVRR